MYKVLRRSKSVLEVNRGRSIYERGSKDRGLASYICSLHYASSGPIHIHKYNSVQHDIIYTHSRCNTTLCDGLILGHCLIHKHNDYNMTAMYSDWI